MKNIRNNLMRVIIVALLLVNIAQADEIAGIVKSLTGEVSIVRKGTSIPATTNMKLMAADTITTGAQSTIGITMQDGTLLSFGAKSSSQLNEFRFDPVRHDGNMLVSLFEGSMRFVTGLLGKHDPASVSIHIPTATIGMRGTDFVVSVEGGE